MSFHSLVLFAGGLGTRLQNTETLPKPLVDINGFSLLSRIINQFSSTKVFNEFILLTCGDDSVFRSIISCELPDLNITFCNEPVRSGRVGALRYFLSQPYSQEYFFVCNADTLFESLESQLLLSHLKDNPHPCQPIVFLAQPDDKRDDYFSINLGGFNNMQNSGLSFVSKKWFTLQCSTHPSYTDIDQLLFHGSVDPIYFPLNTCLYDAGTPERLLHVRSMFR